jgi:PPOX class probable F420-dependent enzyme
VDLSEFEQVGAQDKYMAVVSTARADGSIQSSVVNAGVLPHPVSGEPVVGFVTYGPAKLGNLRERPRATVVFRAGWQWAGVEGSADIIGPDDPFKDFDPAGVPELLRTVFRAAGGTHSDWGEYDRVMREERRAAVLVHPQRIYSNKA